jgi:hypothetical protein
MTRTLLLAPLAPMRGMLDELGVPRGALIAIAILVIGFVTALLLDQLARQLVRRAAALIGSRGGQDEPGSSLRVERAVGRTLYWIIVLVAVMAATETLGLPVVTAWLSGVVSYLPRVVVAVLIVALGSIAGRAARHMVARATASARLPGGQRLGRLAQIAVVLATALVAIEQLGVEIALLTTALLIALTAVLGGAALAFGLGGQHVVANILSAYYAQKLYQVGQVVQLDGGLEGRIARITETAVIVEVEHGEVAVPARELTERRSTLVTRPGAPP